MKKTLVACLFFVLAGCEKPEYEPPVKTTSVPPPVLKPVVESSTSPADRQPFYGDLHLHTGWSFDAWGMYGMQTTPAEAYQFASGEAIDFMGHRVQARRPLDFVAVTDHAEYLAVLNELDDPESELSLSEFGERFREHPFQAFGAIHHAYTQDGPLPEFDYAGLMRSAWARMIEAANQYYQPGRFTTLIGYEWTAMPEGKYNLHRNVIFRGDDAPEPFDASKSQNPEDLWTYMEGLREQGYELLAIPHNSNGSGGYMFDWVDRKGDPISKAYAERRQRNEPLVEVFQGKGQSETMPAISPNDEFADFEVLETLLTSGEISEPAGSYARDALGRGLVLEQRTGINPFNFGMIGSSDFHNGLSTSEEREFTGKNWGVDPESGMVTREEAAKTLAQAGKNAKSDSDWDSLNGKSQSDLVTDLTIVGSAGLAGVWAEENTREAIYDALARKEAFATSGTRLRIRLFAGWQYPETLAADPDWVAKAYAGGVPMGSDLAAQPDNTESPHFMVWAGKDPDGANLDRLQIIKLWLADDGYQEKVYDVALSDGRAPDPVTGKVAAVGNTVNLQTATYENSIGDAALATVWQDPDFDPAVPAIYYARAIEIPTPRWTTILASRFDLPLPDNGRPTLQERAVSSPVWLKPQAQ